MRRLCICFFAGLIICSNALGQGQVLFSNDESSTVSLESSGELLGKGWWAQLWAGKTAAEMTPVDKPVEFLSIGRFFGTSVTIDGIWGGETAFLKVGVWKAPAGSLEEAQTSGFPWGFSNKFSMEIGGPQPPEQGLPLVPARLDGLEPFIIQDSQIPVIGNWVWLDENANGLQDAGEIGIEGISLQFLDCATGASLATVMSDATGHYAFPGSLPETTYIQVTVPEDFTVSPWLLGDDSAKDSNLDPLTATTQCIVVDCDLTEDALCPGNHIDIGLIPLIPSQEPGEDPKASGGRGVSGPGFWKRHPSAWPIEVVNIGGTEYSQEDAIPLISNGSDKSLTMFRQVITTKLNIASGSNADCIEDILAQADAWLGIHSPVPSSISASSEAWTQGKPLAESLAAYNEGEACAAKHEESLSPVELSVGFRGSDKKNDAFRIRVQGEPGRVFVLQRTFDFKTWEDVGVIDNAFGISETLAEASLEHPTAAFRVLPQRGPAQKRPGKINLKGVFKQLENGESITLDPIVYEGDLVITGNGNTVNGETADANKYTVVAGNLDVRGNQNFVSNLTVLGDVIMRGNANELSNIDFQGEVVEKGNANNLY